MGNEARHEQYRGRGFQIKWVGNDGSQMKIISNVIQRHDHHDQSSQNVNRMNSVGFNFMMHRVYLVKTDSPRPIYNFIN